MSPDECDQVRTEVLQQLFEAREQIPLCTPDGANYYMGACYGCLRRLSHGLMGSAEVAELAEQVHAEFTKHWPQINPLYMELLMQLYAEKDTQQ